MKERGEIRRNPDAVAGEPLDKAFWDSAKIEGPTKVRSVHLKLDPDVFQWFVSETQGKGHLTRMQAVLKAYVNAQRNTPA